MNNAEAEALSILMLQLNSKMNDSVWFVKEKDTLEAFEEYRMQAGQVMGTLFLIMKAIYDKHPDLRPVQLGGEYVLDTSIYKDRFYTPSQIEKS